MGAIDFHFLEKSFYYFRVKDHPNKVYSVKLSALTEKEVVDEFIQTYGSKIKALNPQVPASYFCAAYGWFLSAMQYVVSFHDTFFYTHLENIEVQMYHLPEYDTYGISFRLIDLTETQVERKIYLEELYKKNVSTLVELLSSATGIRPKDLYGQLSIGLYHSNDLMTSMATTDVQKAKVHADFQFVTKELDPVNFQLKKNPLDIVYRMIENPREEGKMLRMKPSCCLYYQTEGTPTKCFSCPRLSDKERLERKKELV